MYNRLHSNVDECEQRNFFKLDSRLLEFLNQFVTEEKWGEMSKEESKACSKGITLKTIRVQHQHIYSYCILHCASSHHEEQSSWPTAAGGCMRVMRMAASWHSSLAGHHLSGSLWKKGQLNIQGGNWMEHNIDGIYCTSWEDCTVVMAPTLVPKLQEKCQYYE